MGYRMNPKGVRFRESRDSEAHPNTVSIAFALDVTGSMGKIPELLAKKELPTFTCEVVADLLHVALRQTRRCSLPVS
jgi:hypothetical protein